MRVPGRPAFNLQRGQLRGCGGGGWHDGHACVGPLTRRPEVDGRDDIFAAFVFVCVEDLWGVSNRCRYILEGMGRGWGAYLARARM